MKLDLDTFVSRVRSGESLAGTDFGDVDPLSMDLRGLDLREADLGRAQKPLATGGKFWPFGFSEPYRKARRKLRVRGADLSGARLDRIVGADGVSGRRSWLGPRWWRSICEMPISRWRA